jgi:hypothetical protein
VKHLPSKSKTLGLNSITAKKKEKRMYVVHVCVIVVLLLTFLPTLQSLVMSDNRHDPKIKDLMTITESLFNNVVSDSVTGLILYFPLNLKLSFLNLPSEEKPFFFPH